MKAYSPICHAQSRFAKLLGLSGCGLRSDGASRMQGRGWHRHRLVLGNWCLRLLLVLLLLMHWCMPVLVVVCMLMGMGSEGIGTLSGHLTVYLSIITQ